MNIIKYEHNFVDVEKLDNFLNTTKNLNPVIIYGAGNYGLWCASHILRLGMKIKHFVDVSKEVHSDKPYFVDIVSPHTMKEQYCNETIIVTPYHGSEGIEELLQLTFPEERMYRLRFIHSACIELLPNPEQHEPSQLAYVNSTPSSPKITVLMVIYNTPEHYLRRSIESVIRQTYREYKLLIINHACDDNHTSRIIAEYAVLDKRIEVLRTEKNIEVERRLGNETMNLREDLWRQINESIKTEYICILDSDDLYTGDFLEVTYTAINKAELDCAFVQSACYHESDTRSSFPYYTIQKQNIIVYDNKDKWPVFCETRMPTAWWGGLFKLDLFMKACHVAWLESGVLMSDMVIAYELMKNSERFALLGNVGHWNTFRSSSVVYGSKLKDWKYMILWFEWMFNEWVGGILKECSKLCVDIEQCLYTHAAHRMDFFMSAISYIEEEVSNNSLHEINEFYERIIALLNGRYISRIIKSRKRYRDWYNSFCNRTGMNSQDLCGVESV